MNIINVMPGSEEWKLARAGKVTSSVIADMLSKPRSKSDTESAGRRNLRAQLVAEIMTGVPYKGGFVSEDMRWGIEHEPEARAAYEVRHGTLVDQVGFVLHPSIVRAGASPDGVVYAPDGTFGLVEFKCPKTATHIKYMLAGKVPEEYQPQMLWQMACTGAPWVDFCSFDPRLGSDHEFYSIRFARDDGRIKEMESDARIFIKEVEAMIAALQALPKP